MIFCNRSSLQRLFILSKVCIMDGVIYMDTRHMQPMDLCKGIGCLALYIACHKTNNFIKKVKGIQPQIYILKK